jgi:hypothetical protein
LWAVAVNRFVQTETVVDLQALAAHTATNVMRQLAAPQHLQLT